MSTSSREEAATRAIGGQRVIVADPAMVQLYERVERLAPARLPVLITGETGCGKELVATALHDHSQRSRQRMISLNCAALHEMLVESELFGHEKGAFSGAFTTRIGLIEAADGSTLFLDEVGELSLSNQAKLLRAVESRGFMRLGDVHERQVDVRIVAATHRDLRADINGGRFRQDLYYRLAAAQVHVPPLRQRPNELSLLATTFVDSECELGAREKISITPAAMEALLAHTWPGNVRELKNMMQYFVATLMGNELQAADVIGQLLPPDRGSISRKPPRTPGSFRRLADELVELEIARFREALETTSGNQTHAAGLLGVPVRTFFDKAERFGLVHKAKRAEAPASSQSTRPASEAPDAWGEVEDETAKIRPAIRRT